jgi:hypothetical protein
VDDQEIKVFMEGGMFEGQVPVSGFHAIARLEGSMVKAVCI